MAVRREDETEYTSEEKSIEEIRRLRREKMEARKRAEKKAKMKEIVLSLIFVFICVGAVLGISALVKRPDTESAQSSEKVSAADQTAASEEKKTDQAGISVTSAADVSETEADEEEITETESASEAESTAETSSETAPEPEETTVAETTVNNPNIQGDIYIPSWVTQDFLNISEYNRPGIQLPEVKNVVIHYVGNPGSSAKDNRDFFEDLARTKERSASSHFVIGLQGEILQCVPLWEVAYANYPRNFDTISIEVCHPDATGKFNDTTYGSVIRLAAYLLEQYGLTSSELIRHYDCNGKSCPLFYVEHPDAWETLKNDVAAYMSAHPDIRNENP